MAKAVVHIQVRMGQWMKGLQAGLQKAQRQEFADMRAAMKYMQQQTYYFSTNLTHAFRNPINAAIESSKMFFSGLMIGFDRVLKKSAEIWNLRKTLQRGKHHLDVFGGTKADYEALRGVRDQLRGSIKSLPKMGIYSAITAGSAYAGGKSLMAAGGVRLGWEALKNYKDLEQTLTVIKAIANVSPANSGSLQAFQMLEKEIQRLGETTSWTQQQIAGAAEVLTRGGFSLQETVDSLNSVSKVAKATNAPLDTIADQMLTIMRTFNLDTKSAERLGDMMVKTTSAAALNIEQLGQAMIYAGSTANASGRSVEDVFTEIGALANIGIRGSMQGTVLNNIATRAAGSKKAVALYEELGISPYEEGGSGNIKNLVQLAKEMRDAMDKLGWSPSQQVQAYHSAWGIYGQKGAALGTIDLEPLREAIVNGSEGAANKQAAMMDQTLNGLWAIAMSQVSSGFTEGGKGMAPTIEAAMKEWTQVLGPNLKDQIIAMFQGVTDNLSTEGVLEAFNELATGAVALGKSCLEVAKGLTNVATWMADPHKFQQLAQLGGDSYDENWKGKEVTAAVAAKDIDTGINKQFQNAKKDRDAAIEKYNEAILEYLDTTEAGGYEQANRDLAELEQRKANYEINDEDYEKQKRTIVARKESTYKGLQEKIAAAEAAGDTVTQTDAHAAVVKIGENLKVLYGDIESSTGQMVEAGQRAVRQHNELQQIQQQRIKSTRVENDFSGDEWREIYQEADKRGVGYNEETLQNVAKDMGLLEKVSFANEWTSGHMSEWQAQNMIDWRKLDTASGTMNGIMNTLSGDELLKKYDLFNKHGENGYKFELDESSLGTGIKEIDKLIKENTKVNPTMAKDYSQESEDFAKRYTGASLGAANDSANNEWRAEMQKQLDSLLGRFNSATSTTEKESILSELLNSNWSKKMDQATTGLNGLVNAFPSLMDNGRQISVDYKPKEGGGFATEVAFVKALAAKNGLSFENIQAGAKEKDLEGVSFTYEELVDQMQALVQAIAKANEELAAANTEVQKEEATSKLDGLMVAQKNLADAIIGAQGKGDDEGKVKLSSMTADYEMNKRVFDYNMSSDEGKKAFEDIQTQFNTLVDKAQFGEEKELLDLYNIMTTLSNDKFTNGDMAGFLKYNGVSLYDMFGSNKTGADIMEEFTKFIATNNNIQWSSVSETKEIELLTERIDDLSSSISRTSERLQEIMTAAAEAANNNGGVVPAELQAQIAKVTEENQRLAEEKDKAQQALKAAEDKAAEGAKSAKDSASYLQYATSETWLRQGAGKDPKLTVLTKLEKEVANIVSNTAKFNKKEGSWAL